MNKPKDGAPGTTVQSPTWEGPQENRPSGYLPAKDDSDRARDANGEANNDPSEEGLGWIYSEGRLRCPTSKRMQKDNSPSQCRPEVDRRRQRKAHGDYRIRRCDRTQDATGKEACEGLRHRLLSRRRNVGEMQWSNSDRPHHHTALH